LCRGACARSDQTPLHLAAKNGCHAIIGMLLRAGANVNAVDGEGNTPARMADIRGRRGTVQLLVLAGAAPPDRKRRR
jgi:cytochrome c